jgi:beta-glucosidase
MHSIRAAALLLLLLPAAAAAQGPAPGTAEAVRMHAFVDSLLARMTLEEKLGQLNQENGALPNQVQRVREGKVGSFLNVVGAEEALRVQRVAVQETRLHIPLLLGFDVIHGFRTTFPVPLGSASSWDTALIARAARVAAQEASAAGLNWTFAPMVDIARDPRWGRVVEGAGEDPYLGAAIAAAQVRGFQGTSLTDPTTVMATAKHYVAYGAAEAGRDYNTVDMSERRLREVYLPPFQAAVAAGVGAIMPSFNEINGVPNHSSHWLLTDVLRGEWGFRGMTIADWGAVSELAAHRRAPDRAQAGRIALEAGVDMDMVDSVYVDSMLPLARAGGVPASVIDEAVRRVLRAKYRLGLFQDPYRGVSVARERAQLLTPANRAVARELATRSIVLLKNQGAILPLRRDLPRLAVIGPLADDSADMIGSWGGAGRPADVVPILASIRKAVSPGTVVQYVRGAELEQRDNESAALIPNRDTSGFAAAVAAARDADAVVLVIGESADMTGEASSRAHLDLPGVQQQLAERVLATGKPVVVVLGNGRPLVIPGLAAAAPAMLETWFLGVEAGPAIADVLFGARNPGGKLPISFPRTLGQVPIYYAHKSTGRPSNPGDRWNSKYMDVPESPLFPFGYGLSYTTFSITPPALGSSTMAAGDTLLVRTTVTNTGTRAGDEVVQLYIRDEVASITRPVKELRGFQRVTLQPGERRDLTFRLTADDLAFWGPSMKRITEPGWFDVYVGSSSEDVQGARFELR